MTPTVWLWIFVAPIIGPLLRPVFGPNLCFNFGSIFGSVSLDRICVSILDQFSAPFFGPNLCPNSGHIFGSVFWTEFVSQFWINFRYRFFNLKSIPKSETKTIAWILETRMYYQWSNSIKWARSPINAGGRGIHRQTASLWRLRRVERCSKWARLGSAIWARRWSGIFVDMAELTTGHRAYTHHMISTLHAITRQSELVASAQSLAFTNRAALLRSTFQNMLRREKTTHQNDSQRLRRCRRSCWEAKYWSPAMASGVHQCKYFPQEKFGPIFDPVGLHPRWQGAIC